MKTASRNNSPEYLSNNILGMISAKRAERLLYEWVNLPLHPKNRKDVGQKSAEFDRMITRYPEIFTFSDSQESYRVLGTVRDGLRMIWDSHDSRQRDWDIYTLRGHYQRAHSRNVVSDLIRSDSEIDFFPGLPRLTPFDAGMIYLQTRLVFRMLHCPNSECVAPYFFKSPKVKVQKYCSQVCGNPARRASKLRSYHAHKTEWPSIGDRSKAIRENR
jgi:hypothetical protein